MRILAKDIKADDYVEVQEMIKGSDLKVGSLVKGKEVVEIDRMFGGDLFIHYKDGKTAVINADQELTDAVR